MSIIYYKGLIGQQDIQFGTGTFNRLNKDGANRSMNKLNSSYMPRYVLAKTADFTIDKNIYTGSITFTNESAAGTITFTLPSAIAGLGVYTFMVSAAQQINVDLGVATDYFRDCAAGKYKYSDVAGNHLSVWCNESGIWEFDDRLIVSGLWENES